MKRLESGRWSGPIARTVSSVRLTSPWQTYHLLSWGDRGLLVEAQALLAVARLVVLLVPFRFYSSYLGMHMAESPVGENNAAPRTTLRRVAWAIGAISRRAPWRCRCLEQALAAKVMLRVRGVPNTLYLGVARSADKQLEAHAWVRSGPFYVTGGNGRDRYAVVSTFSDGVGGP
jgi:hypothetical protein